jgi:hypothetical protein
MVLIPTVARLGFPQIKKRRVRARVCTKFATRYGEIGKLEIIEQCMPSSMRTRRRITLVR